MGNTFMHVTHKNNSIQQIQNEHKESLIIYLDPDEEIEGESKIELFMKADKYNSKLSSILEQLLLQIRWNNAKTSNTIKIEAADIQNQ